MYQETFENYIITVFEGSEALVAGYENAESTLQM